MLTAISVLVALVLFGLGAYTQYQTKSAPSPSPTVHQRVQKSSPSPTQDPPTADKSTASPSPDLPVPTVTPMPDTPQFRYPGATLLTSDGTTSYYETSDDFDTVYTWYKSLVDSGNYRTKSTVKTRANDQFKGVLVGDTTSITLEQSAATQSVKITVTLK